MLSIKKKTVVRMSENGTRSKSNYLGSNPPDITCILEQVSIFLWFSDLQTEDNTFPVYLIRLLQGSNGESIQRILSKLAQNFKWEKLLLKQISFFGDEHLYKLLRGGVCEREWNMRYCLYPKGPAGLSLDDCWTTL